MEALQLLTSLGMTIVTTHLPRYITVRSGGTLFPACDGVSHCLRNLYAATGILQSHQPPVCCAASLVTHSLTLCQEWNGKKREIALPGPTCQPCMSATLTPSSS